MQEHADDTRYAGIARALAGRALGMAVDASAFRPRAGEARASMLLARPAARVLLDGGDGPALSQVRASSAVLARHVADAAGDTHRMPRVVDGAGHWREAYYPFVLHQIFSAHAVLDAPVDDAGGLFDAITAPVLDGHRRDQRIDFTKAEGAAAVAGALWRALAVLEWALLVGGTEARRAAVGVIGRAAEARGHGGSLHTQTREDTPDAWVYRELTGLHALHLAAEVTGDAAWAARCREVARFHVEHTQPDYTTYQPWGLSAFAGEGSTAGFAEQQLHDVQTHLSIEGPAGALLPGLLLADASASLDGRIVRGWRRFRSPR